MQVVHDCLTDTDWTKHVGWNQAVCHGRLSCCAAVERHLSQLQSSHSCGSNCVNFWRYCGWLRNPNDQLIDSKHPIIYRLSTIQGGAGFLPSTVCSWDLTMPVPTMPVTSCSQPSWICNQIPDCCPGSSFIRRISYCEFQEHQQLHHLWRPKQK